MSSSTKNTSSQTLGKETYNNGPIFKTLIKITFPIFILMIVNSLYQLVDSLLAANLVDYGVSSWSGAQTTIMIMPIFLIALSITVLTSFGFGTIYAQKLGSGDKQAAIETQSTAFIGALIINIFLFIIILIVTPKIVDFFLNGVSFENDFVINEIRSDAINSAYIYTIVIIISSFQGLISRNLRSEGHIKSMSYIPIISIPINIFFDIVFMKWLEMNVIGAAMASLIAMTITFLITLIYAIDLKKHEKTNFNFKNFKNGINFKIFGAIVIIGISPFIMQILRAYGFGLNLFMIKNITKDIPPIVINNNEYSPYVEWMAFYAATARPMTLIMLPAVAVMQSGSAFLGYNFGAKNYKRVNKGVESMALIMILFALPQYIIILSSTKYILVGFGVSKDLIGTEIGSNMILMNRIWMGFSILNMTQGITLVYLLSTKRSKITLPLIIWNQFIVFTVIYFSMFFTFKGDDLNYWKFFYANPTSSIFLSLSSLTVLLFVIIPDNLKLNKINEI